MLTQCLHSHSHRVWLLYKAKRAGVFCSLNTFSKFVSIYVPVLNPSLAEAFKEWFLLVAINTIFHTLSSIFRKRTVHCSETLRLVLLVHPPVICFYVTSEYEQQHRLET